MRALYFREIFNLAQFLPLIGGFQGGFHLYLLVFPFVYQFNSRIVDLVRSSCANEGFQHHFEICLLKLLNEKDCARTYLQPHYGNGVFGNVYLSAGQH